MLCCVTASALATVAPASADTACRPQQLAQLSLETGLDGSAWVPASINGQSIALKLDTGGSVGMLDRDTADRLNLERYRSRARVTLFGGIQTDTFTRNSTLQLGSLPPSVASFAVFDSKATGGVAKHTLGTDSLSKFDVEIDLDAAKLNLFEQDRCGVGFLQGTGGSFAAVPLKPEGAGKILVSVMLDGKPLTAVVDTGSPTTRMSLQTALDIFEVKQDNPALSPEAPSELNGQSPHSYRYPFKSLDIAGFELQDPAIRLLPDSFYGPGMPQLLLGLDVVRKFRIYVAYDENALYVAPAGKH